MIWQCIFIIARLCLDAKRVFAPCAALWYTQAIRSGGCMLTCPYCGSTNVQVRDALFCHTCGAPLWMPTALRRCPECERLTPLDASCCPYCQARLAAFQGAEPVGRPRESVGCPACGRTIGSTARVCRYCGVDVDGFIAEFRQQGLSELSKFDQRLEAWRKQDGRTPQIVGWMLGQAIIVLALLAVVVFVLTRIS